MRATPHPINALILTDEATRAALMEQTCKEAPPRIKEGVRVVWREKEDTPDERVMFGRVMKSAVGPYAHVIAGEDGSTYNKHGIWIAKDQEGPAVSHTPGMVGT